MDNNQAFSKKTQSLIDFYMARLKATERTQTTQYCYKLLLGRVNQFLQENYELSLDRESAPNIKGYMLEDMYQQLYAKFSPSTRNTYVGIVKKFFGYLTNAGFIETDPSKAMSKVRVKHNDDADPESISKKLITNDKLIQMLEDPHGRNHLRNRAILQTLDGTGLRRNEVAGLNVGTIRNRSRHDLIYVLRKGEKWKWVPISQTALAAIEDYLETRAPETLMDDSPLFLSEQGKRINKRTIGLMVSEHQKRAGLATGVHNFRYTVLNRVERSADPAIAMKIAGHSNLRTTGRYMVATGKELQNAINQK